MESTEAAAKKRQDGAARAKMMEAQVAWNTAARPVETAGQKRKTGTDDAEEAQGLETLCTEMVERFVGLEMTVIHRLEVQDKKLEQAVAKLMGEAQRLRVQGERIIALLEAEGLLEDEEADAEGEDNQAVVVAVMGARVMRVMKMRMWRRRRKLYSS
jgi:hypothetical protein